MNFFEVIVGFFKTAVSWLQQKPAPVKPGPTPTDSLTQLIESQTISLGPLKSGGVIHKISNEEAAKVAGILVATAKKYDASLSMLASLVDGESRFDPGAVNPNRQDAVPGETPEQAYEHLDAGLEQEDGNTTDDDKSFSGLTVAQKIAKLEDPLYGADFCCRTMLANLKWAEAAYMADKALFEDIDPRIVAQNAYNAGQNGTISAMRAGDYALKYGRGVVARADSWKALLGS